VIRVAVGALSPFLASLVAPLVEGAEDMEFVGTMAMAAAAPRDHEGPDVLLVGSEVGDREILTELRGRPALRVLRIEGNGRDLTIHELRPQSLVHHDSTPELLLEVIRHASQDGVSS
jgi:hypothetical protein